jgi:hypothetical protein
MQVFTTIFVAERLPANIERVGEPNATDWSGLIELENSARERIVTLESRNWFFEDDGTDKEK